MNRFTIFAVLIFFGLIGMGINKLMPPAEEIVGERLRAQEVELRGLLELQDTKECKRGDKLACKRLKTGNPFLKTKATPPPKKEELTEAEKKRLKRACDLGKSYCDAYKRRLEKKNKEEKKA